LDENEDEEFNTYTIDSFEEHVKVLETTNLNLREKNIELEEKLANHDKAARTTESRLEAECKQLRNDSQQLRSALKILNDQCRKKTRRTSEWSSVLLSSHRRNDSSDSSSVVVVKPRLEDLEEEDDGITEEGSQTSQSLPHQASRNAAEIKRLENENRELKRENAEAKRLFQAARERILKLEQGRFSSRHDSTLLSHQMSGLEDVLALKHRCKLLRASETQMRNERHEEDVAS